MKSLHRSYQASSLMNAGLQIKSERVFINFGPEITKENEIILQRTVKARTILLLSRAAGAVVNGRHKFGQRPVCRSAALGQRVPRQLCDSK